MFSLSLWGPQLLLNSLLCSDSSFHFSLVWLCSDPTLYECQSHGSNERLRPREYSGPLFYIVSQKPLSLVIWIPHPIQESNPLAWHVLVYQQEENRTARWQSPLPIHQSYCWFSWQKYSSLGREDLQTTELKVVKTKPNNSVNGILDRWMTGNAPSSLSWFPDLCILAMGEIHLSPVRQEQICSVGKRCSLWICVGWDGESWRY